MKEKWNLNRNLFQVLYFTLYVTYIFARSNYTKVILENELENPVHDTFQEPQSTSKKT